MGNWKHYTFLNCLVCNKNYSVPTTYLKIGRGSKYCSLKCSGFDHRNPLPDNVKKREKQLYDLAYREKNKDRIKVLKRETWLRDRDLNLCRAKLQREKRKEWIANYKKVYYSQPENKSHKANYDRERRCRLEYGEYAEAAYLTLKINDEILKHQSRFELMQAKGTINKALQRSRNGKVKRGYT